LAAQLIKVLAIMNNRISNKQKRNATGEWAKHPRSFLKRIGNKKLRKSTSTAEIDEELLIETLSR